MGTKYAESGVDVKKRGIETFKNILSSLFPNAFCVISEDPHAHGYGLVTHTDSAGSKPVQAYLHWRETGDLNWFKGLAQDALAMNIDDVICVGALPINFVDYVAINPFKVDKIGVLKTLSLGFEECIKTLGDAGVRVLFSGGETADLPDQVRTLDVSVTMNGRVAISNAITGDRIAPGDVIIGLRSGGKTKYERRENSGIMCNGLTLARICLMHKSYVEKYPEILESADGARTYYGKFRFDDYLDDLGMTVGEALLSPTRLYAPAVLKIIEHLGEHVSGLVHNTGGGQTKSLRIGRNIHFVKDNIFEPDPVFKLIRRESGESWRAMFENYNMGIGFEIIAKPEASNEILNTLEKFGLEAKIIGKCLKSDGGNKLTIKSIYGNFQYS